jgi:hypothetical protein
MGRPRKHLPGDRDPRPVWRRLACARARQPAADVVASPMTTRVQFADMQDGRARLRAACHLAAELLALSGIDEQTATQARRHPRSGTMARGGQRGLRQTPQSRKGTPEEARQTLGQMCVVMTCTLACVVATTS